MRICEKLRIKRKEKKLTQKELGQAIGVSSSIIRNWENGLTSIPIEYVIPLSRAFRCSPRVFLTEDDHILDWYTKNYDLQEGLCNFALANPDIMKMVLYMVSNWDGRFDMLILMNFYYCNLSKYERSHISYTTGLLYNLKYRTMPRDKMQDVAYKHLEAYFKEWQNLINEQSTLSFMEEMQWLVDKKEQVPYGRIKPQKSGKDKSK